MLDQKITYRLSLVAAFHSGSNLNHWRVRTFRLARFPTLAEFHSVYAGEQPHVQAIVESFQTAGSFRPCCCPQ
jgi:hypothetical protein